MVDGTARERGAGVERELAFGVGDVAPAVANGNGGGDASAAEPTRLLVIDGNRDGTLVLFDHDAHVARLGADTSCATCHHLSLPLERNTGCASCHRDAYGVTDLFDHPAHEAALGGRDGCVECHADGAATKTRATSTACMDCHADDAVVSRIVDPPWPRWRPAASYVDAMHGLCVTCHRLEVKSAPEVRPKGLEECRACHDADRGRLLEGLRPQRRSTDEAAASAGAGPVGGFVLGGRRR